MFLSNASVKRPIAMGCLVIGLALLGLNAWRKLGLELMPKTDVPYITIVTVYPGASPGDIETDVAKHIEDAVVAIDGLKHVSSSCMENLCQTLLEFELETDVDVAATDVREKLDLVRGDFPEDVEDPIIQKYDVNATPIITLALTGDVPLEDLFDFADNDLKDRITTIPGVAEVEIIGGAEREVHVVLDREKLAPRGLTTMHVIQKLRQGVGIVPAGRIRDQGMEISVKYDGDFEDVVSLGNLEIANYGGERIRIRDVGTVSMTTEEVRELAALDGKPGVAIRVVKKADANAVEVTREVQKRVEALNQLLPGGMDLIWFTDDGTFIRATNESAWINVLQGILLTGGILFLFLYNLRSLLVIAITMPLTIVIGLFFMELADFTLNVSTLIAIGMSVGILVTNSIVVLEAIIKGLERSGNPKTAAREGAAKAFLPVLASAGTNMVVLFPLATMGSVVGLFIRPLALTMFIMTGVSLFISFTLTPLLCSLLLKPSEKNAPGLLGRMERGWNRGFDGFLEKFKKILEFNERHRSTALLVVGITFLLFVHALFLTGNLGGSLVSDTDKGEVIVKLEFPTWYSLEKTRQKVALAEERLRDLPELRHMLTTIGKVDGLVGQSSEGVYLAQITLRFSDRTERNVSIHELVEETRHRLASFPDAIMTVSIMGIVGGTGSDIEMEIAGPDLKTLEKLALHTQDLAERIPGMEDTDTTVRQGKPEIVIRPKREVLSDLRMAGSELGLLLRANLEGLDAGTYKENARTYDIVVKLEEEEGRKQVETFQIPGVPGKPLILRGVSSAEEHLAPVQITRMDKQRITKVLGNLGPKTALGTAVSELAGAIDEKGNYPPGYSYRFGGIYEVMAEAQEALGEAGIIALILVILTLAAILESWIQPALILITLPLALIGTVWGLVLTEGSLGIFEIMGMVMMLGIVVNNAILIMDQFNRHIAEGIPRHKAMITATCEQFRPIVMITLAAILGMMPLALGRGIGAELRNGVGIASVGGILVSGILTLVIMPILYDLCTKKNGASKGSLPEKENS
ncbi:MAG TPA: efflux RND transporter permease subunit [Synergistaceae bacterium]|nr:efflux RND transporter permease subunit [Synergistaceae bacterium]